MDTRHGHAGTARLDALDSVGRNAPGVIGSALNNRLRLDEFPGEPDSSSGGRNPFGHPAQENVALLLLDARRLPEDQSAVLRYIRAYRKRFREAFPAEAALALGCTPEAPVPIDEDTCEALINDVPVLRATATPAARVIAMCVNSPMAATEWWTRTSSWW